MPSLQVPKVFLWLFLWLPVSMPGLKCPDGYLWLFRWAPMNMPGHYYGYSYRSQGACPASKLPGIPIAGQVFISQVILYFLFGVDASMICFFCSPAIVARGPKRSEKLLEFHPQHFLDLSQNFLFLMMLDLKMI